MPSYYHSRIRSFRARMAQPFATPSDIRYYESEIESIMHYDLPEWIRMQESIRVENGLLPAIRIAGMASGRIRAQPIEHSRDSVLAEMASTQPNNDSDDILEELFDNGCGNLMRKRASKFGRLMGIELEMSGISYEDGEEIISVSNRGWKTHSDCSIPSLKRGNCVCKNLGEIVCDYCDNTRDYCNCPCRCYITCSNECCTLHGMMRRRTYWGMDCPNCGTVMPSEECTGECFDTYSGERQCECSRYYTGCELVSLPGKTDEFLEKAQEIYQRGIDKAKANGCIHNATELCNDRSTGYHVHIDARDLSPEQSALVVPLLERQLPELQQEFPGVLPDWRIQDYYYCNLINPKNDWKLDWIHSHFKHDCRYKAVNLSALGKHGTIEFRIGFMPDTAEEAISWAKNCRDIVNSVAAIDPADLKGLNVKQGLALLSKVGTAKEWIESLESDSFAAAYFWAMAAY